MEKTPFSDADATNKQGAANQSDSQPSTGSRTEQGNPPSAMNALKFGFFSPKALLPGESWDEFVRFYEDLLEQLRPRNRLEEHLLQQYASLAWRIKRLPEIEAGMFTRYGISVQGNQCGPALAMVASVQTDNILDQLARYEASLRRNAFKFLDLLRVLRKDGSGADVAPVINAQVVADTSGVSHQRASDVPPGVGPTT
jgi:hypothetical protein